MTNHSLLAALREEMPDHAFEEIDLHEVCGPPPRTPGAIAAIFPLYFRDLLKRKRSWHDCLDYTPYLFHRYRRMTRPLIERLAPRFTFQTQSLWDTSRPGIPHFLYTDHTHLENLRYPGNEDFALAHPRWLELEKQAYQNATHVFTMSRNVRRSVIEDYEVDPGRVTCAFAGINAVLPEVTASRAGQGKNILFVGVEWQRKGGPFLLEGFRSVRRHHPDATLTIVGCSPEIEEPGVEIVGRIARENVARYLEQASIFCLPTLREPFGIAFLEAYRYRLPVVGTRIGGIPDFVNHGKSGFLVPAAEAEPIAEALKKLLDDPEMARQFGETGYRETVERYTFANTARIMRGVIEPLLNRRGATRQN